MTDNLYARVRPVFWPKGERRDMWTILDLARDRSIEGIMRYSGLEWECLFAGDLDPELQSAAPHLVKLELDDRKSMEIINRGWRESWGVFLRAEVGIKTLRKHLRTLLRVQGPKGNLLLFRYYDPRVLRVYLPECSRRELDSFFGPVEKWWAEEGFASGRMLEFTKRGRDAMPVSVLETPKRSLTPMRE